ncbi:MAG: autotransporter-associated beta strand repeat-containing protein, partial [Crocinitomicaceae bacterium]
MAAVELTMVVGAVGSNDASASVGGTGGAGNLIVFYYAGPTISTSASLSSFSACSGSNSTAQSFTVSGANLTADIVLTPPTGYEISQSSGSGYTTSTITLAQSGGTVASTTIYVRTTTAATNGASGNITCTSTGATQKDIATGSATISPTSVGGSIAGSATVCSGTNSTGLTLSGHTGTITKWQSSTVSDFSSAVTDIVNATTTQTATNLTATTYYRAVITSGSCAAANSATATVTVSPTSVGGSISGSATVCTGTNSTALTLSGHTGSITKWQYSTASDFSAGLTDVANTTTSLTATDLNATRYYRAVITSGACAAANSASATVTVETTPTTSAAGSDISIPSCGSISTVMGANTPSVGTGVWSITSGPNTNTNQLSSTSSASATFTPSGGAGTYVLRWTISNTCGSSFDEVSVTVSGASYSGTLKVGVSGCHFSSLTDAISKLTSCGYTGNIILELQSNYDGTSTTETFPITFASTLGSGASKQITIQPATGVSKTITGSSTSQIIYINGATYITFDGRDGGTGSNKNLSVTNTSTATGGSAITFINDASNNTVKYCNLKSAYTSASSGVVIFSTTSATTGNDNNTIDYCVIDGNANSPSAGTSASPTAGVATNAIYSDGTSAKTNSGNTISNTEFKDVWVEATSNTPTFIYLKTNNTNWTISGNSFYQSSTRTSTGARTFYGINIGDGNEYTISGNFFGGSSASATGTWTQNSTSSNYTIFYGINLAVGTATATSVQNNTFKGMTWDIKGSNPWAAIYVTSGNVNIGTTTGNTIGATTGTSTLQFVNTTGTPNIYGIYSESTGSVSIQNNNIGALSTCNCANAFNFYGIRTSGAAGIYTIQSNTIGSTTTAGSVTMGGALTAGSSLTFYGIYNTATGLATINSNTIQNIDVYGTAATIYGIYNTGGASSSTINSNTFKNITTQTAGSSTSNYTCGIYNASTNSMTISSNNINTLTLNVGLFRGIWDAGGASTNAVIISSNTIGTADANNIALASTVNYYSHDAIYLTGAGTNVTASNNTIRNITSSGATGASGLTIVGLRVTSGTKTITSNTISYIKNSNTSADIYAVCGMYFEGNATVTATKNVILDLINQTTLDIYEAQEITGIYLSGSSTTANLYNNLIKITNASNTNGISINGVRTNSGTLNLLHNTIVIGGAETASSNAASYTACFRYESTCPTLSAKNNIFINNRTTTSNNRHYAINSAANACGNNSFDQNYIEVENGDYVANMSSTNYNITTYNALASVGSDIDGSGYNVTVDDDGTLTATESQLVGIASSVGITDDIKSVTRTKYTRGCFELACNTNYAGTYYVGTGGTWTTLTNALAALKTCNMTGSVTLELNTSYAADNESSESYPLDFSGIPTTSLITLTIRPKSDVSSLITLGGSSANTMMDINGTDYVTIDGRPGGSGSNKYITIDNTNTTSGATAVNYYANATNNTIQYCTLKSTATGATSGVVTFGTGSNSSNSISNCDIDGGAGSTATPTNAARVGIYSTGTANDNISITNNKIYNCFNTTVTSPHAGIYVGNGSSAWTITGNSIYQTSNRTVTGNTDYYGIVISNTSSVGNTVSNNYIGGTSNSCGGTKFTFAGNYSNAFHGIYINVGTASSTTVNGNTVANLSFTSSLAGNYFYGINVQAGNVNIGTTVGTGNIIGSRTADASVAANASITLIPTSASANNALGIYSIIAADHTVNYNRVAGINVSNSTAANPATFYGIYPAGTTANAPTVTYNSVGSNNNVNSIVVGTGATTGVNTFYGITNQGYTGVVSMQYDTIQGVKVYGTGASLVYPIYNTKGATNSSISSNTIKNISNESTGSNASAALIGIYNEAAPSISISSNTISAITCKNGYFRGIEDNVASAVSHAISSNTIGATGADSISISSTSTTASMGINAASTGTYSISSNTIQKITQSGAAKKDIYGIRIGSTGTYTVRGNTIDKLYCLSTGSYKSEVTGVFIGGIANAGSVIEKNKITNFKNTVTNGGFIFGIIGTTVTTLNAYNNFFECDNENTSTVLLTIYAIYGDAITTINAYHNTIYIYGQTGSNTAEAHSFCLRHGAAGTINVKNNILINTRVDGGTTAKQQISFSNNSNYDYNYYYTRDIALTSGQGTNSIYHVHGTNTLITINSDGSLTSSGYTTVSTGTNLGATVSDDIRGSAREDYTKGCYEGSSMIYYSRYATTNTDANSLTNWTTKRDGTGSTPSNFTTESKFKVQTGHKYQVTSTWSGHASSIIYVESGGALDVNAQNVTTWSNFDLAGTGVSSSGALLSTSSSLSTVSLPITLSADATVSSSGSGNLTLTGNITTAGYTLTVNGSNNTTISTGVISGTGIVSKSGSGILTLSGTNTHTGGTTVSAGTLAIGNDSGLGTGTLTINGGSLDASGADRTITNPVTISNDFGFTGTYNLTQNTGGIALTGAAVITVTANNLTLNGVIANSGNGTVTVTSTGNGTWTCPAGVTSATVHCWGGGGGGSYTLGNGGQPGGGGGAYVRSTLTVSPGTVYNYTVGVGGTKGIGSSSSAATNGGDSYFGNTTAGSSAGSSNIAKGGNAGVYAGISGAGGLSSNSTANGSNPQKYSGGIGGKGGSNGGAGSCNNTSNNVGGSGGGGAGSGSDGEGAATTSTKEWCLLNGGTGDYPGGDGSIGSEDANAGDGSPRGGGGGGADGPAGTAKDGGNGGAGQLIITYTPAQSITKSGAGTLTLGGTNTFSNGVTLNAGTLNINNVAALGATTGTFTINGGTINNTSGGAITMNNYPMSWAGHFTFTGSNELNMGAGAVAMTATRQVTVSSSTLTVGGIISGSTFGLTKLGAGTMTLSGVNTYTGATTVTAGTLAMGVNNAIPVGGGGVVLNGGTLSTGNFTAGSTSTNIGTLTLSENSTLALGTGTLYFSSSTGVSWTAAKTLTITGFVSSATNTAGTAGRLFVDYRSGNDCSNCGLTGSSGTNQLGLISFNTATINGVAGTYGAMQMVSGEIVAFSVSPTITLASNTISAADNCASSIKVPIQSFSLAVTNGTGNLTNVGFTTTGTYVQADISKYQLWYHSSNDITGASQLGTDLSSSGGQGARTFTSFTSPTLSNSATYYFWITVDVASGATNNATIAVNAISTSNLTSTSTKVGSDTDAGGTQTLKSSPSISSHPSAATICYGGTYSPSVTASGGVTLSYQWQFSTDGSTGWSNVVDNTPTNATFTNNTTATLTQTGNIAQGSAYYYRCVVSSTGNGCSSVNSNAAQLTINADPTIGTQPSAIAECLGGTDAMSVSASGGTPSLTYQWYSNTTSSNTGGSSIGSATSSSYTVPSSSAGTTYYYVEVNASGSGCSTATSNAVAAVITAAPNAGTLSGTDAICSNGSTTFTSNGDNGGSFTSATTAAATVNVSTGAITPVAAGSSIITYTVTGTGGCSNATATRTVTVTTAPNAGTLSGTEAICSNGSTTFTSNGDSGGAFTSATTAAATVNVSTGAITPVAAGSSIITYTVTGTGGCSNATATRTVTVTTAPNAGTLSGTDAICSNGSTTFTSNGDSGGAFTSATTAAATVNVSTGAITPVAAGSSIITYTVTGTGGCSNATATRTVTVTTAPNAGTLSGTQGICSNGTTTFSSDGGSGAWTSGSTGVATINSSTGVITPVAAGSSIITYTVTGTGGCSNATATRTVTVTTAPNAGTLSGTEAICSNGSTTFTSNGDSGGAFTSATTAAATVNVSTGAITPVAAGSSIITYTVTGTGGCSNATATRTVTVTALPTASISYAGTPFTTSQGAGQAVSLTGTSGGTYSSTAGLTIDGSTGSLTPSSSTIGTYTVTYTIAASGGCAQVTATTNIDINSGVTTFYFKGSGLMNNKTSWTANSDGSTGTEPTAMSTDGCTFNIFHLGSNATPSLNGAWTLGTGSKIVVGNGTNAVNFTMPYTITGGQIDVSNNATLTITTTTNPTLGTLNSGSTIVYAGSSAQTLPTSASIPNLTINNSSGVNVSGNSTVSGTLTLTDGKLNVPANTTLT